MKLEGFDKYLGNKLFEARVIKRITQDEMAVEVSKILDKNGIKKSVSRQAYTSYELGKRSMPNYVFEASCKYLGLDWKALFNEALDLCKVKDNK